MAAVLVLMAAAGAGFALTTGGYGESSQAMDEEASEGGSADRSLRSGDPAAPGGAAQTPPPLYFSGTGTWTYAEARPGEVIGSAGTLMRYNVAVEDGIGLDVVQFSDAVHQTLSDPRSWTAGDGWRFEQVGRGGADFTVYLASPEQRSVLCEHPGTSVSCRNGDAVVINSARWLAGVPHWDDTIESYREYVVNHEIGHRLGHGHEVCPEDGGLSPVMAQQTYRLAGCESNAWPFPDGETYLEGPAGDYGGPELPPDQYDDR